MLRSEDNNSKVHSACCKDLWDAVGLTRTVRGCSDMIWGYQQCAPHFDIIAMSHSFYCVLQDLASRFAAEVVFCRLGPAAFPPCPGPAGSLSQTSGLWQPGLMWGWARSLGIHSLGSMLMAFLRPSGQLGNCSESPNEQHSKPSMYRV